MSEVSVRYIVTDLDAAVAFYTGHLVRFRRDLIRGIGGNQVLLEDPSGNPIELFEPARRP
jgi:hypothetical protein